MPRLGDAYHESTALAPVGYFKRDAPGNSLIDIMNKETQ